MAIVGSPSALAPVAELVRPRDVVLVKGSRRVGLERLVARLLEERGAPGTPEGERDL